VSYPGNAAAQDVHFMYFGIHVGGFAAMFE
jgi:hypothetical protein